MNENWTCKKLGDVCDILDSKRKPITKRDRKPGNIPYYGATGIQDYVSDFIFDGRFLLVGEDGAKWGKNDNTAYIIEGKSWVNNHAHILKMHNEVIDAYVRYFLNGKDLNNYITGAIVQKLTQAALASISIPIPSIAIQSRIVSELDLLQSIIDKQKAQLKELDNLAQSIFYDMFGNPVENEKGWEVKKLGDFCSKIGSGATPRGGNESYKSEGVSLIRSLNVHNNAFIYKDLAFIDEEQAQALSNVEVQLNDILLNITGASVARCCIVPNQLLPARVNQHVCIIRPSKDAEVRFLSRLLTNSQYQVFLIDLARGKAATREALPKNIVEGLPIILPPLSLQQSFAQKIKDIERQRDLINQSIREAQTLFDSRMEYYFGE